jgi:hypothetical protein
MTNKKEAPTEGNSGAQGKASTDTPNNTREGSAQDEGAVTQLRSIGLTLRALRAADNYKKKALAAQARLAFGWAASGQLGVQTTRACLLAATENWGFDCTEIIDGAQAAALEHHEKESADPSNDAKKSAQDASSRDPPPCEGRVAGMRAHAQKQFLRTTVKTEQALRNACSTVRKVAGTAKKPTSRAERLVTLSEQAFRIGCLIEQRALAWDEARTGLWQATLDWPDRDGGEIILVIDIALAQAYTKLVKEELQKYERPVTKRDHLKREHFVAYLPDHSYIHKVTRAPWTKEGVNAAFAGGMIPMNEIIDRESPVHSLSWLPGESMIVEDCAVIMGGRIVEKGHRTFNLYKPSMLVPVAGDASPWLDLIKRVYPNDHRHIIDCFAFKVQHPGVKINHMLVLGGSPRIGKDTIIAPVRKAVGDWNVAEIAPSDILKTYTEYRQSVILRVSEAKDQGESNRYDFYDATKILGAAPPDTFIVNEKYGRKYYVVNVTFVVITTNYRTGALYLPRDDFRHYVAWSEAVEADFAEAFWKQLYGWYENENGYAIVTHYLASRDLSHFNPKAPPVRTPAFWAMVDAEVPAETSELADLIDRVAIMKGTVMDDRGEPVRPKVVTVAMLVEYETIGPDNIASFLTERKNSRRHRHLFEQCGYLTLRNEGAKDGRWKIDGKRQTVYFRNDLSTRDACDAVAEWQQAIANENAKMHAEVSSLDKARQEKQAREAKQSQVDDGEVPF